MHISKVIYKCKSKKNDKTLYYLDQHGTTYRKSRDGPTIFHATMVLVALQPYISYESHNAIGHRLCNVINGSNISNDVI